MTIEPAARTTPSRSGMLIGAGLLAALMPSTLCAQSDAGTVAATVTVDAAALTVTGLQDLTFGIHFATDGIVLNETSAVWLVDTGGAPGVSVDLVMTQLPSSLDNGAGDFVSLNYGANSFFTSCGGAPVQADPAVGITSCLIDAAAPGGGNVAIGELLGLSPDEFVEVDLQGAVGGTYTGTMELTATVN